MCVYIIPTQLEKGLLSYFDFTDFGGHSGGAQFLGCQLQIWHLEFLGCITK